MQAYQVQMRRINLDGTPMPASDPTFKKQGPGKSLRTRGDLLIQSLGEVLPLLPKGFAQNILEL